MVFSPVGSHKNYNLWFSVTVPRIRLSNKKLRIFFYYLIYCEILIK
jgi:hypothetical protein